ncbi:sigma-70 family RNA polymerase sigma factor [Pedosphaera parvula]|uniref:sigma-70 family RNA polymerase sigma factor n=1 Tax=Pedosphaera parvula TaxID=1032527 RepID=UPI001ED944FC|nr:sigma-70 family RNA polymerase sigma factor [Pedosphaera parvula]
MHSCALRLVSDPHLAEEITQAVFILLARKAHTMRPGVAIPGWLFRTTRFVAARALRTEHRRQQRDQEAFAMQHSATPDDTWKRIAPLLDDALEQLGETDRNAVLLRFMQERNHREVGEALGFSEEAARKRVDRALEKLRGFFTSHGFTLSAALLASTLVANAAKASSTIHAGSISSAAVAGASTAAAATLPALVAETLAAWRWSKLKIAASIVAAGTAALLLMMIWKPSTSLATVRAAVGTNSNTIANSQTSSVPKARSVVSSGKTNRTVKGKALLFHVVAKDTGEPIANAKLAINSVYSGKWESRFDLSTDQTGTCPVPLPNGLGRLDVGVLAPGWGARYATWRTDADPIPNEYTLKLERVTNSVGGWLRDEEGRPVTDAEIWIQFGGNGDASFRETPRERVGVFQKAPVAKSDRGGHWSASIIPSENPGFELEARHPDFAVTSIEASYPGDNREKIQRLWKGTLTTIMENGVTLTGNVIDEAGRPIHGAQIAHEPFTTKPLLAKAGPNGEFSIPGLESDEFDFTVTADGFAPEYRKVTVAHGMEPVNVQLRPGALLKLLVMDDQGAPVPDATVGLEQWGEHRQVLDWKSKTDANGRIEWNSAPPQDTLELYAKKEGWCYTRSVHVIADGQEHTIKVERELNLSAHVTDSDNGQPIAAFNAVPGYGEGSGEAVWWRGSTRKGANGMVKVLYEETRKPWRVRIEAEGYLPFISDELNPDFSGTLEVALKPVSIDNVVRGTVFLPDGKPAANAQVALLSLDYGVTLDRAKMSDSGLGYGILTNADAAGLFVFPANPRAHSVVAVSAAGYAKVRVHSPKEPVALQLQPWGRIEGSVAFSARSHSIDSVVLMDDKAMNYQGSVRLGNAFYVKPDSSGRFAFENVPPGQFSVNINRGLGIPFCHRTLVTIRPGETSSVEVGAKGRTVVGQLAAAPGQITNWVKQVEFANLLPTTQPSRPPSNLTVDAAALWAVDYWQSAAAAEYNQHSGPFGVVFAADGTFRAEAVTPGTYSLQVVADNSSLTKAITIPDEPAGTPGDYDLGTFTLPAGTTGSVQVRSSHSVSTSQ